MSIESQLVEMIASSLAKADKAFVKDFVENGPIPGGVDGANRYGTVAKLAMRQPFVLFKGLTFQKLCLP
ncbi:hypothetical protein, partial [Pseudomonas aeruginosa]|uniref:hypothetical protein n=1 Tax=Pseudomonas aeruginosa TaxID=287 RepID=UPI001C1215C2